MLRAARALRKLRHSWTLGRVLGRALARRSVLARGGALRKLRHTWPLRGMLRHGRTGGGVLRRGPARCRVLPVSADLPADSGLPAGSGLRRAVLAGVACLALASVLPRIGIGLRATRGKDGLVRPHADVGRLAGEPVRPSRIRLHRSGVRVALRGTIIGTDRRLVRTRRSGQRRGGEPAVPHRTRHRAVAVGARMRAVACPGELLVGGRWLSSLDQVDERP